MIKRLVREQDKTIINIYAPNMGAPKTRNQILTDIKGGIENSTIIVGDFNIPLISVKRSSS